MTFDDDYEPFGEGIDRNPTLFSKHPEPDVIVIGESAAYRFLYSIFAALTMVVSIGAAWYATIYIIRLLVIVGNKLSCCGSDIVHDFSGFDSKSYLSRLSQKVGTGSTKTKWSTESSSSWGGIFSDLITSESVGTNTDETRGSWPFSSGSEEADRGTSEKEESTSYSYSSSSSGEPGSKYSFESATTDEESATESYSSVPFDDEVSFYSRGYTSYASGTTSGNNSSCYSGLSGFDAASESSTVRR